ncbi:MAC/perforin domain-containing protein [Sediminitomix flava]|uniref:MAC/Perforin domain-containing protein n=1 Tax=Sediminitomix flava TaxID=379075 RepID=A0A315ZD60_SEDFL|nr:MAC/perforin domain-containing protein [Sediminitomix flava]PWJ43232.1 MAC/Perforin domain-containing protein [Sediminitomix flava]
MKKQQSKLSPISLLVFCLGIFFTACEEDLIEDSNEVQSGTEDFKNAESVLGRGYDATLEFCNTTLAKEEVLNFTRLVNDGKIIKDTNIESSNILITEGNSIQDFQKGFEFSISGGVSNSIKKGLFSGEAKRTFNLSKGAYNNYSYATYRQLTSKYGLYVDGRLTPSNLYSYVTDSFLQRVENTDFSSTEETLKFINSYGTHVCVGGTWGGSLLYNMSAERKTSNTQVSLGQYAEFEATIKVIGVSGNQSLEASFEEYFESSTKTVEVNAIGGKSELAGVIGTNPTEENYYAWLETIGENPVLCNYYPGGLIPIWEFIEDSNTKSIIEDAISIYYESKGIETIEATKSSTKTHSFQIEGDQYFRENKGDNNMDTENGKNTGVKIDVELRMDAGNDENVIGIFHEVTFEEGGIGSDKNTRFVLKEPYFVTIPINNKVLSFSDGKASIRKVYSKNISGQKRGYFNINVSEEIPFLKNVKISYDEAHGSDLNDSKIKGEFVIDVIVPNN